MRFEKKENIYEWTGVILTDKNAQTKILKNAGDLMSLDSGGNNPKQLTGKCKS